MRHARPRRLKPRRPDPIDASDPTRVEALALRYLARREYAAAELRDKLTRRGYDDAVVAQVVAALGETRAQHDDRFVDAFVRSRVARGHGPVRIAIELKRRGIDGDAADAAVAVAADWNALAAAVRRKRFGAAPRDRAVRAKQGRFLEQRGFTHEQVRAALSGNDDEQA